MISVVILCAGSSTRFNGEKNKVLLSLGDKPVFMHSVDKFKKYSDDIIVVSNEKDIKEILNYYNNVVLGGNTRQGSVYQGVQKCKYEKVLIHDGARPFVSEEEIKTLISSNSDCAYLGIDLVNSIKLKRNNQNVDRADFVEALTPQKVRKSDYLKAYEESSKVFTDDVSLINEVLKKEITLVKGSKNNFKITTQDDYELALKIVNKPRIGHSWDCHQLVSGRKLVLGGIEIPFEKGLLGHSDADALLHAISESLLGALALGDLGTHFPDNDPKYLGIDSKILLRDCYCMVSEKGYVVENLDTMIYAEAPKMKKYIPLMQKVIADILEIATDQVSIKATTYERMESIGKGLAIACESHVLLSKKMA